MTTSQKFFLRIRYSGWSLANPDIDHPHTSSSFIIPQLQNFWMPLFTAVNVVICSGSARQNSVLNHGFSLYVTRAKICMKKTLFTFFFLTFEEVLDSDSDSHKGSYYI